MRLLAYCVMPDHWHLLLWPRRDGELSNFVLRLTNTHTRRPQLQHPRSVAGGLYQGRYKNFAVQGDGHLLTLCRYIEANALRAKLVRRAENWPWSSLSARAGGRWKGLVDDGPVLRPRGWAERVNQSLAPEELAGLRISVARGRPYGSPEWVKRLVGRLGLEFTVRPRGRPPRSAT